MSDRQLSVVVRMVEGGVHEFEVDVDDPDVGLDDAARELREFFGNMLAKAHRGGQITFEDTVFSVQHVASVRVRVGGGWF